MPAPQSISAVEALTAKLTREGVLGGGLLPGQWCQGRRRGVTFCGRLIELGRSDAGQPVAVLRASAWPGPGLVTVTGLNVTACESLGDGRCQCAGKGARAATQAERGAARATARAVPLGNTGITAVPGGTA